VELLNPALEIIKISYKKKQWRPPSKKKKRGENPAL
jgi:hypothetical protein